MKDSKICPQSYTKIQKKFALWKNLPKMFIAAKNYKVKYPQPTDANALAAMLTGETVQRPTTLIDQKNNNKPPQPPPPTSFNPPPQPSNFPPPPTRVTKPKTAAAPAADQRGKFNSTAPVAASEVFQQ